MDRQQNPNLEILEIAVDQLGNLVEEMVFIGGCSTGLLITDPAAPHIRITLDVDTIVQVASIVDYYRLSDKLREKGFKEDASAGAPICRWITENVILDVMPTDTAILGFGNQWYSPAMEYAEEIQLPSNKIIRMVSAPYFLITKLEAFTGRGKDDYLMSHDIEDVIAVLDGRPAIIDEVRKADSILLKELSKRFNTLLNNSRFIDAVSGHMPSDEVSQARVSTILKIIKKIVELK